MITIIRATLGALLTLAGVCVFLWFGMWLDDVGKGIAFALLFGVGGAFVAPDAESLRQMHER